MAIGPDGTVVHLPYAGLERAAAAADAEFLKTDDLFQVLQLRPMLKAEVPDFYKLKPGELVLCVLFAGRTVRRIGVGADVQGEAAIRHGLSMLRRYDPEFYSVLQSCLDFTRRAERFMRAAPGASDSSRRQRRRSGRR
ncbi:hypothetical protein RUR49_11775 [Pseudoxanthobacter sp. M-2]|uniref:hypothetical protein n=1 Tax=Pseudoxanthobacter sp. M-2 TaxID=3078754 RepID=UPI0038FCD7BD